MGVLLNTSYQNMKGNPTLGSLKPNETGEAGGGEKKEAAVKYRYLYLTDVLTASAPKYQHQVLNAVVS